MAGICIRNSASNFQYLEQFRNDGGNGCPAREIKSVCLPKHRDDKTSILTSKLLSQMQQPVKEYSGLGYIMKELTNGPQVVYHPGDNRGWSSIFAIISLENPPIVGDDSLVN